MNWQPIETAPKDGRRLLLIGSEIFIGGWKKGDWVDDNGNFRSPSHWMPLPEEP